MATLLPLMEAIQRHVEKAVLACDAGGPGLPRFKLFRGERNLSESGGQQRTFDAVWEPAAVVRGPSIGAQAWDYDLTLNIEVAYDTTRSATAQMISDYDAVCDAIRASDKTTINGLGFGFFRFADAPTVQTSTADTNVVFGIFPVMCRVTVEH